MDRRFNTQDTNKTLAFRKICKNGQIVEAAKAEKSESKGFDGCEPCGRLVESARPVQLDQTIYDLSQSLESPHLLSPERQILQVQSTYATSTNGAIFKWYSGDDRLS